MDISVFLEYLLTQILGENTKYLAWPFTILQNDNPLTAKSSAGRAAVVPQ